MRQPRRTSHGSARRFGTAILVAVAALSCSSTAAAQPPPPGGKPSKGVRGPTVPPLQCTITGTRRSETLIGTYGKDVICGRGGSDRIYGRGGSDIIFGGSGNDRLVGGGKDDFLDGGRGRDRIYGGQLRDIAVNRVGDRYSKIEQRKAPPRSASARAAQQRFGEDAWRIPRVTCTPKGFVGSIDTATRFNAAYLDRIWWRPIGWQHNPATGTGFWNVSTSWQFYDSVPPDGTFLFDWTGQIRGFAAPPQALARTLFGFYAQYTKPAIQAWSQRGGLVWDWVGATTQGFSEDYNREWCWVPPRDPNDPL